MFKAPGDEQLLWQGLPKEMVLRAVCFIGGTRLEDTLGLRCVSRSMKAAAEFAMERHLTRAGDPAVRKAALAIAIAAAGAGRRSVHPILARVTDKDAAVRTAAISALSYLVASDDEEVPATLAATSALLEDVDDDVRQAAASCLQGLAEKGHKGCKDVVASAVTALQRKGASVPVLRGVLGCLGSLVLRGDADAVEAVVHCIDHEDLEVHREAIVALGEVSAYGEPSVITLLCELAMTDPDPKARCAAVTASVSVAARGDHRVVSTIISCLEEARPALRVYAIKALAVIAEPGDRTACAAVAKYLCDDDAYVRSIAEKASASLEVPEELPGIHLPRPPAIEGVKSKKAREATLLSIPRSLLIGQGGDLATQAVSSDERFCNIVSLSRSSRAVLSATSSLAPALSSATTIKPLNEEFSVIWRHPRCKVAILGINSDMELVSRYGGSSPLHVLTSSNGDDAEALALAKAHLSQFGLSEHMARGATVAELPRAERARLSMAAACWPSAPHVLVLEELEKWWGLGRDSDMHAFHKALDAFQGGVLICETAAAGGERALGNEQE